MPWERRPAGRARCWKLVPRLAPRASLFLSLVRWVQEPGPPLRPALWSLGAARLSRHRECNSQRCRHARYLSCTSPPWHAQTLITCTTGSSECRWLGATVDRPVSGPDWASPLPRPRCAQQHAGQAIRYGARTAVSSSSLQQCSVRLWRQLAGSPLSTGLFKPAKILRLSPENRLHGKISQSPAGCLPAASPLPMVAAPRRARPPHQQRIATRCSHPCSSCQIATEGCCWTSLG